MENHAKVDPKSIKNLTKIVRKSTMSEKCRALRLGSRLGGVLEASWAHLRVQHSSKLASQIEGKSVKKTIQHQTKHRCLPRSSFDAILIHFGKESGSKLVPESKKNLR